MSGTLASRFQGRFGYQPSLRAGLYPGQTPGALPQQPVPTVQTPQAQQPAAQPAPVVSAGSMPMGEEPRGDGPDGGANTYGDFGPSPGTLGGGLSGFGVANYGTMGSVLGGLAGLALGVPGLGMVGGTIGSAIDTENVNGMLSAAGFAPGMNTPEAALSNSSFGLAGRSTDQQLADQLGIPAPGVQYGLPGHELDLPASNSLGAISTQAHEAQHDIGPPSAHTGVDFTSAPGYGNFGDPSDPGFGGDKGDTTDTSGGFGTTSMSGSKGADFGGFGFGGGDFGDKGDAGSASASASDASPGPGGGGDKGDPGWQDGGYTGAGPDGAVQPDQAAGTVHEGETVLNAEATNYYGAPLLLMLNEMQIPRSRLMALAKRD